jgi:penicillin-binding protein 1A
MTPLEMAVAFSAFADNGTIRRPYLIKEITDDSGAVLFTGVKSDEFNFKMPEERQVITGDVAAVMADLLSDSGDVGNARGGGGVDGPLIGKTGTTNEHKDTWFVGAVPGLAAVVWVGYDNPVYSTGRGTGAGLAGPLWGKIVGKGMKTGNGEFTFSPSYLSVTVCKDSGKLPRASCPRRVTEVFTHSHLPGELCDEHDPDKDPEIKKFGINRESDFH